MFRDWLGENEQNGLDADTLTYPATTVLVADGKDFRHPHLMMPVYPVFVMDSLAPNPSASPQQIALALRKMTDVIEWESRKNGHGEIWFIASEPSIAAFAEKQENFIEVTNRVFRFKIDREVG